MIEIYEGVIYRKTLRNRLSEKLLKNCLLQGKKNKKKDEGIDLLQRMVKLFLKSLYGAQNRKNFNESFCCKSEHWMQTEFYENVLEYWKLPKGIYTVNFKKDDGLDDNDCDIKNSLSGHLGSFISSSSKGIMNNFIKKINGFYNSNIYYTNNDSLYIETKYWNALDKVNLVGKNLCQGKNYYETIGVFYGFFLAPKIR